MPEKVTPVEETAAELRRLMEKATPGPWGFYHPSELPKDWRIARFGEGVRKVIEDGGRCYLGRFTSSHDPTMSGDGGGGLQPPREEDIRLLIYARNSLPAILDELDRLRAERDELAEALWQDESGQFHALLEIKQRLRQSEWLLESRGPYEWDDDRYKDEAGTAFRDIEKIIAPIEKKTRCRMVVGGKRFDGIGAPLRAAVARAEAAEAELARLGRVEAAARAIRLTILSSPGDDIDCPCGCGVGEDDDDDGLCGMHRDILALDAALAEVPK